MSAHRDFTEGELTRPSLRASVAFDSPFTNPILLVDPYIDLGRGLLKQLTRHGFRADLAITVCAARVCAGVRYYRAMVVVADLSDSHHLFGLWHLREAAPQTWIIVVATNSELGGSQVALSHGGDACLVKPFQFSALLLHLKSLSHLERTVQQPVIGTEAIHVRPRENSLFTRKAPPFEPPWRTVTIARIRLHCYRPN